MANKEAKAPSSAKTNKVNRNLSGAIGELSANLHNMVYGSKNLKDSEEITSTFNDILKGEFSKISDKNDAGSLTTFISSMNKNQSNTLNASVDVFDSNYGYGNSTIDAESTNIWRERLLKQREIHRLTEMLNELNEAIYITRDAIVASDTIEGHMSRELRFGETPDKSKMASYNSIVEKVEEKFKIQQKIKNFIVPKTLEYGDYYAYVIPYKNIFDDFSKYKETNASFESCILESVDDIKALSKDILVADDNTNVKSVSEAMTSLMSNITVVNDDVSLPLVEEGADSIAAIYEYIDTVPVDKQRSVFEKVLNDNSKDVTEIVKEKEFEDIKDCYIKLIDSTKILPIRIMSYTIGYYYIMDEEGILSPSELGYVNSLNQDTRNGLVDQISSAIIKSFNKKFLENNVKFKELISSAIMHYNLHERKLKFQFIPAEHMVAFTINEDEEGMGRSILEKSMYAATLYSTLQTFTILSIVRNSNDTKVHYIKSVGIDKDFTKKIQHTARKMKQRHITVMDMFNYQNMVSKLTQGNEMYLYTGRNNERGIETETLQGQDVQLNTDLMENLRTRYISGTGVPSVIMSYINEAEFAKTIELANNRFMGRVVSDQLDFNTGITQLYRKILKYSTSLDENIINEFEFAFSSPKFSNSVIQADLLNNFETYFNTVITLFFDEAYEQDPYELATAKLLKMKLMKEKLPLMNIDDVAILYKEAKVEAMDKVMAKQANKLDTSQQEM